MNRCQPRPTLWVVLFRLNLLSLLAATPILVGYTQSLPSTRIHLHKTYGDYRLTPDEEQHYQIKLRKRTYYQIQVIQKGIDLMLTLTDVHGHRLQQIDSPTGKTGIEELIYAPDSTTWVSLVVNALPTETNRSPGSYTIRVNRLPRLPPRLRVRQLQQDLATLQTAYQETRVGYWYNTSAQMDSLFERQRKTLTHRLSALAFYRLLAPLVTFTKEGHSSLKPSEALSRYSQQKGQYVPLLTDVVNRQLVIRNDWDTLPLHGRVLTKLNGCSVDSILHQFLTIEPADGFNQTSKYHWIAASFGLYYQRFYPARNTHLLELLDVKTGQRQTLQVPAISYPVYQRLHRQYTSAMPPAELVIDSLLKTATLTFNTFRLTAYDTLGGFRPFVDRCFQQIRTHQVNHLIIDIRRNEGGSQGTEDYVLSNLIEQPYQKYSYVSLPAFRYSFYAHTDRRELASQVAFETRNRKNYYTAVDGRILASDSTYRAYPPQAHPFKGRVSILIGGLTFSGASEFAALAKNHTKAVFIGEETGGGYYGNTSGQYLQLTLPHSQLKIRLPLIKFVVHTPDMSVPYGHGVLPDYAVQPTLLDYATQYDRVLEFAKTH